MTSHNRNQGPNINSKIVCDVASCVYNDEDRYCTAGQIKVGHQHTTASTSADTLCVTFKPL